MCYAAPGIIYLLDRMGVTFNRTPEGFLDFRRFGGTLHHRTAFAGASTGQQLLYALDEQVRRQEAAGHVKKYEHWEMLSLVQDGHGVCRGLIAMERSTLELKAFPADAVIMATGGPGLIFGKSTNSMVCTGSAVSASVSSLSAVGMSRRRNASSTARRSEDFAAARPAATRDLCAPV